MLTRHAAAVSHSCCLLARARPARLVLAVAALALAAGCSRTVSGLAADGGATADRAAVNPHISEVPSVSALVTAGLEAGVAVAVDRAVITLGYAPAAGVVAVFAQDEVGGPSSGATLYCSSAAVPQTLSCALGPTLLALQPGNIVRFAGLYQGGNLVVPTAVTVTDPATTMPLATEIPPTALGGPSAPSDYASVLIDLSGLASAPLAVTRGCAAYGVGGGAFVVSGGGSTLRVANVLGGGLDLCAGSGDGGVLVGVGDTFSKLGGVLGQDSDLAVLMPTAEAQVARAPAAVRDGGARD